MNRLLTEAWITTVPRMSSSKMYNITLVTHS